MNWGVDLWDQFDALGSHTNKGIEFVDKFARFVKERCDIENEYAAKIKKLVKAYQPKKKEEEEYEYSHMKGFLSMLNEVHDMAGQHEMISENFTANIYKRIVVIIGDLKQERKKLLQDGAKQLNALNQQMASLEKSKKTYDKAFKDWEKSVEGYKKADADIHLSKLEVQKAKTLMETREQHCETCKKEYASELQKTNDFRRNHYETIMPNIINDLQTMDSKRINNIKEYLRIQSEVERNVIPIISTCLDGIQKASDSVDHSKDNIQVIEKFKSGFEPPGDIAFEDLSNANNIDNNVNSHTPKNSSLRASDSMRGTVSGGKTKKRGGIFGIFSGTKPNSSKMDDAKEDYSHLPPNQQKKKLHGKIEEIRQQLSKETAQKDALTKMQDVYRQNPALGDPASLNKQLEENAQTLDRLIADLKKYEGFLQEADNKKLDDSQKKTSDTSLASSHSNPSTPRQSHQDLSGTQPQIQQPASPPVVEHEDSFDELEDDFPIIGKCKALYPFDSQNEGSIVMSEGQEFSIVEADQGDGWTRVRNGEGEEGFVPTSYIECTFDQ